MELLGQIRLGLNKIQILVIKEKSSYIGTTRIRQRILIIIYCYSFIGFSHWTAAMLGHRLSGTYFIDLYCRTAK